MFLCLLLLAAQSFALQFTIPSTFGGKTDFSDRGWRSLISELSPSVYLGQAPSALTYTADEPSCPSVFAYCATSYFGNELALGDPDTAQLWVKWHQDATPFACDTPDGCTVSAATSVADLTSQTKGWSVTAAVNAKIGTNFDKPTWNGETGASLSFQYSDTQTYSTTITSTTTLSSVCFQNNLCFLQTGTLMMSVSGVCARRPVISCSYRDNYVCEEFNSDGQSAPCQQWADFTQRNCISGLAQPFSQDCSVNVAVLRDDGQPVSFQVFEQVPIPSKRSIDKRDFVPAESPFGALPDGSSGAWMAWSP